MHITGQRRGFRSRALRLPRLMRQWPISSTGREDSIRSAVRNMLRQGQRRQPRRLPPRQGSDRDNGLHDDGLRGKHHRDLRRRDPHRVDKWEFRLKNTRRHHLELSVHALPIMTVAASETMPRRDITGIPPGLSRLQSSGLQTHSGKNFPTPFLVPLAPSSAETGWRGRCAEPSN